MNINDIVGSKKRKPRISRGFRTIQKDLYTPNLDKLNEADKGARIQHVEDLILGLDSQPGMPGAKKAIATLHQVEQQPNTVTIKWDGSPAVMFGRNEQGEFILTDKSGFTAKGYDGKVTSPKGLEDMLNNRGTAGADPNRKAFAKSMATLWPKVEECVPADFRGFVLGDLLWLSKLQAQDNTVTFTPNTTTYTVRADSDIGKKVLASDVGVVIHKAIGLDGETSNVDMSQFISGATLIMPPAVVANSPGVDIPAIDELENYLNKNASAIDKLFAVPPELKMADFAKILYAYINNSVKAANLDDLGSSFQSYVEGSKLSVPKKQRLMEYINSNIDGFNATFNFIKGIMKVKNQVIKALDAQKADIEAYTAGERGGEGYVVDKDVKLVNRSSFTAANMARER